MDWGRVLVKLRKSRKMKDEYVIINKAALEKRIEELEKESKEIEQDESMNTLFVHIGGQSSALKNILSQSTPLIPEIEKAFDEGKGVGIISYQPKWHTLDKELYNERKQDYISNLELDI